MSATSIGAITENDYSFVSNFGRATVGTTFVPVCFPVTTDGPVYRTPQLSQAAKLRVAAGNAADAPGGAGARSILIEGLGPSGHLQREVLLTGGASAGPSGSLLWLRLFRAYIYESGAYASQSQGSHVGDIEIQNAAGTENWLKIDATEFPVSQSEVAAYTVPYSKIARINRFHFSADSSKLVHVIFFQRQQILNSSAPYQAMRILFSVASLSNQESIIFNPMLGPISALSDIGVLARVDSTTAEIHCDFDIVLEDS